SFPTRRSSDLVSRDNSGSAYFGDFVIEEYDENGNYLGNVCEGKISSLAGWYFWSQEGSGKIELAEGRRGGQAIKISGTTADANAAGNEIGRASCRDRGRMLGDVRTVDRER